ncbi:MAG: hypothetical protein JO291_14455 [Acidimicrobiia bacterium]|nr:hypothetical protein [Acidimicrobiia bacterium]
MGVEELFERDYARLVRALGVAFGPEAAADAVQDAFIRAARRWGRVGRLADPAAWVRRDLTDERLDLRKAIDGLPDQMRITVCLHYLADLSVEDVAAALAVAPGTVKSNLHDARKRLRIDLEEEHHG